MTLKTICLTGLLMIGLVGCSGSTEGTLTVSAQNAETLAVQATLTTDFLLQMDDFVTQFADLFEDAEAQAALCQGGSASITPNDVAPLGVLSTGDSIIYTFNNCSFEIFGITFSFAGTVTLTATEISGTPGAAFVRELDVSYQSFTFTLGEAFVRVDGSYTVRASSPDGNANTTSISGTSLAAYLGGPSLSVSRSWTDFALSRTEDTGANTYAMTFDGTYYGSIIGGSISFETPATVSGGIDSNPDTGTFRVTGLNGSTVTINALDNVNVELLIDEDGDEVIDATITTTWAALEN